MLAAQARESDFLDASALRDGQRDVAVAVCDALLDLGDGKCLALGTSGFATVVQEVLVQALAATGVSQDQPVSAPEAVDRALQVVVVSAGALAVASGDQDVLHRRPTSPRRREVRGCLGIRRR